MYLNLDLLYNTYKYLFPLFYYGDGCNYYVVYSSMTKKSIYINYPFIKYYCDFITFKIQSYNNENSIYNMPPFTITEEYIQISEKSIYKVKPFKLDKETTSFLKSNTRIN